MKFVVSKKQFATALKAVMPAVALRATLPVLAGIRLTAVRERLMIEATDLEAAARRILRDSLIVEQTGEVVTSAKQLVKAIASLTAEEVTVESVEIGGRERLALRAGTRTVTLDAYPADDFPATPDDSSLRSITTVRAATLADAFARAVLCASRDEARLVLTSVALFFEEGSTALQVIATDSYRMGILGAQLDEPAKESRILLVPARVAKELAKQMRKLRAPVTIGLIDRGEEAPLAAGFAFGSSFWSVRLIEGEFPNWRQIVPEETGAAVEFEAEEVASALKAVQAVGNGNATPVRLSLGETTTITLVEGDATHIRETLATATFSPDGVGEIEVAFNPGYLADALRFVGEERARLWVRDGLKPALIGPADRRYVLMPVRLS